ncbi:MAG: SHOCT domain-containing protein [Dehalococcoidia bacterium]
MWHYHDGMGWWMVFIGISMIILFLGITLVLLRDARKTSAKDRGSESDRDRALDIARERYARGEISKEEFEQIRRDLS